MRYDHRCHGASSRHRRGHGHADLGVLTQRLAMRAKKQDTDIQRQLLFRQYFPKGTEITRYIRYLNAVADEINGRPRTTLGFRAPAEVFAELILADNCRWQTLAQLLLIAAGLGNRK